MPRKNTFQPGLAAPDTGVTVRMYHTGFGDCFLLAFRGQDGNARYVLIDCGVHHQYVGGPARMALIAQDIARATGNRLHVVAITHEHTDHLYGFKYAAEVFQNIKIDELWLAWTEDPGNTLAAQLKRLSAKKVKALSAAVDRLKASGSPLAARLEGILGFDFAGDSAGNVKSTGDVLKVLCEWSGKKLERSEDYRKPGETIKIPGVKGVKCYVLGPPQNIKSIKKLVDKKEMYSPLAALNEETAFVAAILASSGTGTSEDSELFRLSKPFDENLEIPEKLAKDDKDFGQFFKKHYGFDNQAGSGPGWRRIDADWLAAADELALSINSMTNNTSLVLAFELTETASRKVLLFAGDAQIGNWLSWQELELSAEQDGKTLTGAELLERTVLYKVGHHGSLNATPQRKGLEMMESNELLAMIPVDENWARTVQGWNHPEPVIVNGLMEKARGRVIRSDKIPTGASLDKAGQTTETEWKAFVKNVQWDKGPDRLWIQYTVQ